MKMNDFVRLLCFSDENGKEITAAQARKVWRILSLELFAEGEQDHHMDINEVWRDWISHPMLIAMYKNGKRLNRGERRRAGRDLRGR